MKKAVVMLVCLAGIGLAQLAPPAFSYIGFACIGYDFVPTDTGEVQCGSTFLYLPKTNDSLDAINVIADERLAPNPAGTTNRRRLVAQLRKDRFDYSAVGISEAEVRLYPEAETFRKRGGSVLSVSFTYLAQGVLERSIVRFVVEFRFSSGLAVYREFFVLARKRF